MSSTTVMEPVNRGDIDALLEHCPDNVKASALGFLEDARFNDEASRLNIVALAVCEYQLDEVERAYKDGDRPPENIVPDFVEMFLSAEESGAGAEWRASVGKISIDHHERYLYGERARSLQFIETLRAIHAIAVNTSASLGLGSPNTGASLREVEEGFTEFDSIIRAYAPVLTKLRPAFGMGPRVGTFSVLDGGASPG